MGGKTVIVHCDGACFPNPGKGSWGAVIWHPDGSKEELMGASEEEQTTNQRMEILAAIMALEFLEKPSTVQIFSDSQYLIKCITGKWKIHTHLDLWGRLKNAAKLHRVSWHWVKGHAGNKDNERADELSNLASPVPADNERRPFQAQGRAGSSGRAERQGRGKHPRLRPSRTGARRARRKQRRNLLKYPRELRGLPNNRYGGHQSTRMRTYNPQLPWSSAGECRVYTEEEKRELERKLRAEGRL